MSSPDEHHDDQGSELEQDSTKQNASATRKRKVASTKDDGPACYSCRRKKARCSREQPCSQCLKLGESPWARVVLSLTTDTLQTLNASTMRARPSQGCGLGLLRTSVSALVRNCVGRC